MRNESFVRKIMHKGVITVLVFTILSLALIGLIVMQIRISNQKKLITTTQKFVRFEDYIQTFLVNNVNQMRGFSAYIQTFQDYKEEEVYDYLGNLLGEDAKYTHNVGIIKDTTIIWNYPKQGNEKAIGTDLSKIPEQADSVAQIKKTMKYSFDGPVNLVQGGAGYIMRIPIVKNNAYWGMISIVLKADEVKELFDSYAKECGLRVAIISKSKGNSLVYGDEKILNQSPVVFDSEFSGAQWTIYVILDNNTANSSMWTTLIITVIGLMFILWVTYLTFRLFQSAEEIENRNDSLSEAVMKDALTGIYNRKYLDSRIVEETERVNRHEGNLSMVFFDLDHFKIVNDTYGHSYGDTVLKEVAAAVKQNLRSSDIFARWGGEEFAILMPETTLYGAVATAEKLRVELENIVHPIVGRVTASFGVSQYIKDEFIGSWFNRVDRALYVSKTNGRNLVSKSESSVDDISTLVKIHWTNDWLSGNKAIDDEHKELLRLENEIIESSYIHTSQSELIELANQFANQVVMHFKNEERILTDIGYDNLEEHMAIHKQLIESTEELIGKLSRNLINSQELFQYMKNEVIIGHLIRDDMKYYHHFK